MAALSSKLAGRGRSRGGLASGWRYLGALLVIVPALIGSSGDPHVLSTLTYAAIWAAYGVGYDMFSGFSGRVNLGYAMFPGLAAYTSALLNVRLGLPPWLSMAGGVLASVALAAVVGALTLRIKGIYFALATSIIPLALFQLTRIFAGAIGGEEGIWGIESVWMDPRYDLWTALGLLAASYLLATWYTGSKAGLVLRAIQGRETAAQAVGQNTFKVLLVSFMVSVMVGGAAGAYIPHFQMTISPEVLDISATLQIITFAQVGGPGTLIGPALGAFGLMLLNEYLREFVEVRLFAYFAALILLLRFAPRGLVVPAIRAAGRAFGRLRIGQESQPAGNVPQPVTSAGRPALSQRASNSPAQTPTVAGPSLVGSPNGPPGAPSPPEAPVLVRVEDLVKRFGGLTAVDHVNLAVREGEVVGIVGPNGAGKTTLFNMLTGFVRPTQGRITFRGRDITHAAPHDIARLWMVRTFQLVHPFPGLSVLENLVVGGLSDRVFDPGGREQRQVQERAVEVAHLLHLERWLHRPAEVLPYGVLKRVKVGRTLMANPRVLLLDEPFAGIGGQEFEELLGALRRLIDQGLTMVIIEHKLRAIMQLTRRVVVLHFGQVIADGQPAAVASDARVQEAYLGAGGATRIA